MRSAPGEDGEPALDRRAPFATNGQIGARARQTQQRILDAALRVFDEVGYETASLEQIAQLADRSRVAVYQYFADKDHLFRELTTRLAAELWASLEALAPVTPDAAGWEALQTWLARQGDLHRDHRAVFREFAAATSGDEAFIRDANRTRDRQVALFASRVTDIVVPDDRRIPAIRLLLAGASRTLELAAVMRTELPDQYDRARVTDALTDVVHRSLFGPVPGVNSRTPSVEPVARLDLGPRLAAVLAQVAALEADATLPRRGALTALLAVGDEVIVRRGRLGTRVEDVIEAAGVSRGAFYRYFDNGDEYVRVIAARALRTASAAFGDVPDLTGADPDERRAALRRWLEAVEGVHHARRTLLHAGTGTDGSALEASTPGSFDWGRRRMARLLDIRTIGGDVDVEALALLGLVEGFGAQARSPIEFDTMIDIVDVGFLGG